MIELSVVINIPNVKNGKDPEFKRIWVNPSHVTARGYSNYRHENNEHTTFGWVRLSCGVYYEMNHASYDKIIEKLG